MFDKENTIKEIIASYNFKGDYSIDEIKRVLQSAVGKDTNLMLEHETDSIISEDMTEVKRTVNVKCVQVVYSDLNGFPRTIKLFV